MFTLGDREVKGAPLLGDFILCECGERHRIKYGMTENEKGEMVETKLLAFYSCKGVLYLAGIGGKDIRGNFKKRKE